MLDFIPIVAAEGDGLSSLGTVFTWIMGNISTVVTTIVGSPLLLLPVGIFAAGATIGLAKRFIGR